LPAATSSTQQRLYTLLDRRGSLLLMWALLVLTLVSPLADFRPRLGAVLTAAYLVCVIAGAECWGNKKIILRLALPLAGLWIIARLLEELGDGSRPYDHAAHFVGLALSCAILWAVFDRIGSKSQLRSKVISEAFIGYLIIAIAFSQLYWILNDLIPRSFSESIPKSRSSTFLYFSLTTLSGVGFGDILPVNPFVRLIAALETITGIFFIAVVVARLVSSYPSGERSRE
jgi:hypothetical protein